MSDLVSKSDEEFFCNLIGKFKSFANEIEILINNFAEEMYQQIMSKLKSQAMNCHKPSDKKGYASVTSKSAIIEKPKNLDQSVKTRKSLILQYIDPVESNIAISQIYATKNGSLMVHCHGSESAKFRE